jgi:hypothetical protein
MQFKILNKRGERKKKINLLKTLDLLLWHQIQVLALLIGAFSVSLSLLKVGMFGCVTMDAAPLYQTS